MNGPPGSFAKRRVACIALSEIRIEICQEHELRRGGGLGRLAIVVARPGDAVQTERDVRGGTRLDVVSAPLRALGVLPGTTVAAARAKCATLHVRVLAQKAVRSALERVAEVALAFGPTVALGFEDDVVWLEIGGCSHLYGGEQALAYALGSHIRALGHACRIAIADGPRVAAAVARYASAPRRPAAGARGVDVPISIVASGKGEAALCGLPIEALSLDEDTLGWLRQLGLRSCGDLQALPRRALGLRLGERGADVLSFLAGEDRAPLDAWRPPEVPEERVELEWAAESVSAVTFLVRPLCERLAARLSARGRAASRLELVLGLDRAFAESNPSARVDVTLPSPLIRAEDLLAVMRSRLERVTLEAPVLAMTLRAPELTRTAGKPLDLLSPETRADLALPRLLAELAAELGENRLGTLALQDTWRGAQRTRLTPIMASNEPKRSRPQRGHSLVTAALEPSRVVPPFPVRPERVVEPELLARFEAIEWWRQAPTRCDFVAAWVPRDVGPSLPVPEHIEHEAALAWVELSDKGDSATILGWID